MGSGAGVTAPISSQWPVVESLPGPSGCRRPWTTGAAEARHAEDRGDVAQPEVAERRQLQPADALRDVRERVGAGVAVVGGIREGANAAGVEDDDGGPAPAHCGSETCSDRSSGRKTSASILRKLSASA